VRIVLFRANIAKIQDGYSLLQTRMRTSDPHPVRKIYISDDRRQISDIHFQKRISYTQWNLIVRQRCTNIHPMGSRVRGRIADRAETLL
jgi:hypothetical protein